MSGLTSLLQKKSTNRIPVWFMRQAGRYLPEYREIRAEKPNFLDFCYDIPRAVEVTLQPLRRFDLDAAIIFSDILVIPDALGQEVSFDTGHGPRLQKIDNIQSLRFNHNHLTSVYNAITEVRGKLPNDRALIGFAGSPFTLFSYMIEGQGSKTFDQALRFIYTNKSQAIYLRDLLQETIIQHLISQIDAGVDVVQLFDSWAGMVPAPLYEKWVIQPHVNIVSAIRQQRPNIPIICFPRGSGVNLLNFVTAVKPDAISIDTATHMQWAVDNFENDKIVVQGNLDPALLCAGGDDLTNAVNALKSICKNRRWIMNLGHGVLPPTPPDHISQVIKLIRDFS